MSQQPDAAREASVTLAKKAIEHAIQQRAPPKQDSNKIDGDAPTPGRASDEIRENAPEKGAPSRIAGSMAARVEGLDKS